MDCTSLFIKAKRSAAELRSLDDARICKILNGVADAAVSKCDFILAENRKDLEKMDQADPN